MAVKAYRTVASRQTKQTEPIFGQSQVKNNAGGFVYAVSSWDKLLRFLVLGSEGGTYYVGERTLTLNNAANVVKCIEEDGLRVVRMIVEVSQGGRAPKNDPAIFALALCASAPTADTRAYALQMLPQVCRIPTHLFHFLTYVKQFRGFGRGLRTSLASWYNTLPVEKLAYEVAKYQSRDGWSNADVLRLAHPKTTEKARNDIYKWIVDGDVPKGTIIEAMDRAKTAGAKELVSLIERFNLSREMLPTEALTRAEVWDALLPKMPMTAMIRNLGNMSKVGLLVPNSDAARLVRKKLRDEDAIRKARIHPVALLIAMKTYGGGRGLRGKGEWNTVQSVVDALNDAFYLSFGTVEPTGKRLVYGVDVSGSMSSPIGGLPISCAEGAAAMALASAHVEDDYCIMGFAGSFVDLGITPKMRFDDVLRRVYHSNFGTTDCSLPMTWALSKNVKADAFVVITDSETYAGRIHPSQALKQYREATGIAAKEVVVGMTATDFTIADPNDPLTLDVVGFDTATPQLISEFVRG